MDEGRTVARGVKAIAEAIDEPASKKVYYRLEKGHIPGAFKEGQMWCLHIPTWLKAVTGAAA